MRSQTFAQVENNSRETPLFTPLFLLTSQLLEECQLISVPRGLGDASQLCSSLPHRQEAVQPDAFGERIRSPRRCLKGSQPLSHHLDLNHHSSFPHSKVSLVPPGSWSSRKWSILASLGLLFLSYSAGKQSPAWFSNWIKTNCSAGFDLEHSAFQQCDLT